MTHYDALHFLPRSRAVDYPKGSVIFEPARPPESLYLVLTGRVKVCCIAPDGGQTLLRVAMPETFFGECALVSADSRQHAIALDEAKVMNWSADELSKQIEREPMLSVALFTEFAECNRKLRDRVAMNAWFNTGTRVTMALVHLGREMGERREEGAMRITGLTHQAIADYVGTSREIVTCEMNRLRRLGFLSYSRRHIDVFADALVEALREQGTPIPAIPGDGVLAVA